MLKGKNIIITGCLQGIGRATMNKFASYGANIFACSYKKTDEFEESINELSKNYCVSIIPIYFDMNDNESIKEAVKEIQKMKIPINALINIAGIARDAIFHMVTMEQMHETFQINFYSQIVFTQYITKLMLRNGSGSVVFTSSITGYDGNNGQLAYGASKAALHSTVKTLSKELGPKGIRVNAIAPGVIETPMTIGLSQEVINSKLVKSDIGRMGTPDEVADLYVFLASDMSSYITGQVIRIDGGIG